MQAPLTIFSRHHFIHRNRGPVPAVAGPRIRLQIALSFAFAAARSPQLARPEVKPLGSTRLRRSWSRDS
jgi:hypothetical protein